MGDGFMNMYLEIIIYFTALIGYFLFVYKQNIDF